MNWMLRTILMPRVVGCRDSAACATHGADDPWLRYSCCRALREISGQNHFADWLFGDALDRESVVKVWKDWREAAGAKLTTGKELVAKFKPRVKPRVKPQEGEEEDDDAKEKKDDEKSKEKKKPRRRFESE